MNVHIAFYFDIRRPKKDGKYPVKLRLTYDNVQKYIQTGITLSVEEWDLIQANKAKKDLKKTQDILDAIKVKARDIVNDMEYFEINMFKKKFLQKRSSKGSIEDIFNNYIKELKDQKRIGSAISYSCALKSLQTFKTNIYLKDITSNFLHNYEDWMISNGKSITTVGMYLRSLRSIFNIAISEGMISSELYPFGKRKYQIPTGVNVKKALTLGELERIIKYETSNESVQKAKDFWVFSYLCQGINPKDIALLKFNNLIDNQIHFYRAKTINSTKSKPVLIRIFLSEKCQEIIKRWQNTNHNPENYIFPILKTNMSAEKQYSTIQQFTKTINKYINIIAQEVGINKKVTTYTARHSYSTVLKTKGASIEYIAESLGHTDTKTTQNYLDSFDNSTKQIWTEKLLEFG